MDLGKLAEDQGFDGIFAVEGGLINDVMATVQADYLGDQAAVAAAVSDLLADEVCLVGPLSRCREQLAAFRGRGWRIRFWRRRLCHKSSLAPRRRVPA